MPSVARSGVGVGEGMVVGTVADVVLGVGRGGRVGVAAPAGPEEAVGVGEDEGVDIRVGAV